MKKFFYYVCVFVITVAVLFTALVVTAKIPREAIADNIKKSSDIINRDNLTSGIRNEIYKIRHAYAEIIMLSMIYYIDTDNPIQSVMEAKYYSRNQGEAISIDLKSTIQRHEEGNTQYIRYWHGSMIILRPLLVFFDMSQIYIINAGIMVMLTLILFIKLKNIKKLIIAIAIAMTMCYIFSVPFTCEYTWVFLVMLVVSIIAVDFTQKGKNTNILFLLSGIFTCYFDFLTTEIITLFIPLLIILAIKYEKGELTNLKSAIKIVIASGAFWTIGYLGMWLTKWILATIILEDVNIYDTIIKPGMRRINGTTLFTENAGLDAIKKNFEILYPIKALKENNLFYYILGGILVIEIIFINKKDFKKLWFSLLLIVIATVPYIRYMMLENHSYEHYFFTFRIQMITIIAIILAICYSLDMDKVKYEVKRKKKI